MTLYFVYIASSKQKPVWMSKKNSQIGQSNGLLLVGVDDPELTRFGGRQHAWLGTLVIHSLALPEKDRTSSLTVQEKNLASS